MGRTEVIEVLIVEDDERVAEIQRLFIERIEGFTVVGIACCLEEARTYISVMKPDLLLLDLYFPEMNGLEFLKEMKQLDKQPDVIMVTAAKEWSKIQEAIAVGVFDYVLKPVLFDRFKRSLERYRQYVVRLEGMKQNTSQMSQAEVDALFFGLEQEKEKMALPKGIDPFTLEKTYEVTKSSGGGYTAEHIAGIMGVSRTTARRYLEYLVAEGKLKANLVYGTVGRPERVYMRQE